MSRDQKMKKALEDIRRQEQENDIQAALMEKAKIRQFARMHAIDQANRDLGGTDERGNKSTNWDNVAAEAQRAINAEVMSYSDWRAAMMSLLTMFSTLNNAIHKSIKAGFILPVIQQKFLDGFVYPLKDMALNKLTGNPELDLPILMHDVEMDAETGNLKVDFTRSDDKTEKGELDFLFKQGIEIWLSERGYTKNPATGKFEDGVGVELNKEEFDKLKAHAERGLDYFLTEYTDVQFKPSVR